MDKTAALTIATLLCVGACQPEATSDAPGGEREIPGDELAGTPAVTPTEYTTSMQFLPLEGTASRGITLEFANTATSDGLNHSYLGWELSRAGWRSILEAEFQDPPTRAPWRLFPAEALRLTVNADGDPDVLILSVGSASYTLDLGDHLDGWEDRAGTRHELREATLTRRGERVAGVAVQHRFAIPGPDQPARFGPYERVILRSEDGAIIVFFHTRSPDTFGNDFAWMYADGLTRRWTALETRTVEVANSSQLRRNVPIRSWFRIPEPDIRCELTAAERMFNELSVETGPKPYHALYWVRGWIEFAGERVTVEGLLERGET
ncbi:MAG: hypothetical protein JSV86_02750 [Gemmatimonadota bacterium]|nr:MAG: hypothetical protein JSV86_02750 [Gemmatimonadota bacterium]